VDNLHEKQSLAIQLMAFPDLPSHVLGIG